MKNKKKDSTTGVTTGAEGVKSVEVIGFFFKCISLAIACCI